MGGRHRLADVGSAKAPPTTSDQQVTMGIISKSLRVSGGGAPNLGYGVQGLGGRFMLDPNFSWVQGCV